MKKIIFIALRLFLAAFMIYGGIEKFKGPKTDAIEVVEKAKKFTEPEKRGTLQKILYISGAKQTGYFWEVLGIAELLFGILLLLRPYSLIGAILLLPITLHILLFHYFLEPDEILGLVESTAIFGANIALVLWHYPKLRSLLIK